MNYVPILSYCKISRDRLKSKSGLILIPETADKRNARAYGTLDSVGEGCCESVKALVGKRVLFKEFSGSWVELEGERTFVVEETDILGEIQD